MSERGVTVNTLIVYDSTFGNTRQIAAAIAEVMGQKGSARLIKADQLNSVELEGLDLMVMGCPTHRHGVPKAVRPVLDEIPRGALRNVATAAFDTRYRMPRWKSGSAAGKVARKLRKAGGRQVVPPESFFVVAREGPLDEGEVERAKEWADSILGQFEE
jgi:flavodoxin